MSRPHGTEYSRSRARRLPTARTVRTTNARSADPQMGYPGNFVVAAADPAEAQVIGGRARDAARATAAALVSRLELEPADAPARIHPRHRATAQLTNE